MTADTRLIGHPARAVIAAAAAALRAAEVDSPRVDAELLAAHVLDVPRGRLLLIDAFSDDQHARYLSLVAARARRVPLQHLVGTVTFGHVRLEVGPGVFVPRPETEQLVEWALAALDVSDPVVVDFCSGTGAIALSIGQARPDARVLAVEREPRALRWLRRNVAAYPGARVEVVEADVTLPDTLAGLAGAVDMLLCNPPYVPDAIDVPPEVRADPGVAVFGGADGLEVIRPVVARAGALLRPGGRLGLEHDESHASEVAAIVAGTGRFRDATSRPDLAGRPRFPVARAAG